jgi:predicted membrane chloride channel (bestrophin family)
MVMAKTKQKNTRTYARNRATAISRTGREKIFESDSTYFLKLVVFVLLGTLWLKFAQPVSWLGLPVGGIPLGLLVGLVLVSKFEKYQSDRKIWYAILVMVTIICYFVPAGIVL